MGCCSSTQIDHNGQELIWEPEIPDNNPPQPVLINGPPINPHPNGDENDGGYRSEDENESCDDKDDIDNDDDSDEPLPLLPPETKDDDPLPPLPHGDRP